MPKKRGNPPIEQPTITDEAQDAVVGNPPFESVITLNVPLPLTPKAVPARFVLNVGSLQLSERLGYPGVKMIRANSGGNEYVTSDPDEITALYKAFMKYGLCDPISG